MTGIHHEFTGGLFVRFVCHSPRSFVAETTFNVFHSAPLKNSHRAIERGRQRPPTRWSRVGKDSLLFSLCPSSFPKTYVGQYTLVGKWCRFSAFRRFVVRQTASTALLVALCRWPLHSQKTTQIFSLMLLERKDGRQVGVENLRWMQYVHSIIKT